MEIEVRQHVRVDQRNQLGAAAGADVFVLGDQVDHLERNALHQNIGGDDLRPGAAREERGNQA